MIHHQRTGGPTVTERVSLSLKEVTLTLFQAKGHRFMKFGFKMNGRLGSREFQNGRKD